MASGTYGSVAAATITPGRMLQPETRVIWNGDLETTSYLASAYNAPVGFTGGTGLDLGTISSLSFQSTPTITPIEQVNFRDDTLMEITGEETTLTVTIKEFSPEIMNAALGTGTLRVFVGGAEAQITFGGLCNIDPRPLVLEWTNVTCEGPATPDVRTGITGGKLTLYRTVIDSGLNLGDITSKTQIGAEVRFKVLADTTRASGNRLGNIYLF